MPSVSKTAFIICFQPKTHRISASKCMNCIISFSVIKKTIIGTSSIKYKQYHYLLFLQKVDYLRLLTWYNVKNRKSDLTLEFQSFSPVWRCLINFRKPLLQIYPKCHTFKNSCRIHSLLNVFVGKTQELIPLWESAVSSQKMQVGSVQHISIYHPQTSNRKNPIV